MNTPVQKPDFSPAGSISCSMASRGHHSLERWLNERGLNWLNATSLAWLDTGASPIYCIRGDEGSGFGIQRAIDNAASSFNHPHSCSGITVTDGRGNLRGYIGVDSHLSDPENLLLLALASELTFDPSFIAAKDSLQLVIEEVFVQHRVDLPPAWYRTTRTAAGISSQAGLASVMHGAAQQDALPGGMYGVPLLGEPTLPQPMPGVDIITHVPGFGGGLHG